MEQENNYGKGFVDGQEQTKEVIKEKVELFEKEIERMKKVFPRWYAILITKYREIFSR